MSPEPDDAKQQELQAQLEDAMRRKQEMLEAQRAGLERKREVSQEREVVRQKEVQQEAVGAQQRGAAREVWRQDKHAQERAAVEERKKAKIEAERKAEEDRKGAEAKKKQQAYLGELHRNAVKKRIKARHESAVKNEEMIIKHAETTGMRTVGNVDGEEQYKIAHFESERKRRLAKAAADKEFAVQRAEETARRERQLVAKARRSAEAAKSPHAANDEEGAKQLIERNRRKAVGEAEDTWNTTCMKINAEMDQFVREAKREALTKRERSQKLQQQRTSDAKRRRKAEDEYLGIEPEEA